MPAVHEGLVSLHAPDGEARSRASVVILVLNWNGEDDTAACVESMLSQRDAEAEVVIIDNASADGSGERLRRRYPALTHLETRENLGYAGGNNAGLAWAMERGAEWILVVNNDTVADPDCVARMLAVARVNPRLAAVAPLIVRYDDPTRVWFAGGTFSRMRGLGAHDNEGAWASDVVRDTRCDEGWCECTFLTGCCLLLRAEALGETGPFRADYFAYGEDVELSLRLRAADWRLGWVPGARLAHRVAAVAALPSPFQITMRDRNRRRMVREHYSLWARILFRLWFWPTRLVHLLRYAIGRDVARARAIVAGMTQP